MKRIISIMLCLPLLMTACKNDTEVDNPDSTPITLLANIASIGVETRGSGVISDSYASELPVNFARINQSSTDGSYSSYSDATALDATRAAGSDKQQITFATLQTYLSDATYNSSKFVGWYPRAAMTSGAVSFTVDGSTDIMLTNEVTGSPSAKFNQQAQAFTFAHQLTQLQLKVYAESNKAVTDWGTISTIKVKNQQTACTVTLPNQVTFSDGTESNVPFTGVTSAALPVSNTNVVNSGYVMIPEVAASGTLTLEIVTSIGGTKTVTLPVTTALAKSNAYVYTLKFTQTSISVVGTAQVGEWITAATNNYEVDASTGALNLSNNGTANSYIARPNGVYKFNATVMGNGATTTGITPTALAPVSASVLWETNGTHSIITETPTLANGYVTFRTPAAADGNAVIAVKDGSGNVIWSWHIWVTNYKPGLIANTGTNTTTYSYNSNLFMDRNLGATSITPSNANAFGMMYQWGRKDPFPASASAATGTEPTLYGEKTSITKTAVPGSNNLTVSIQNPATFYYNASAPYDWYTNTPGSMNGNLWSGTKTIYDPCPPGWRVPAFSGSTSPWNGITLTGTTQSFGRTWASIGYYPAAGRRSYSTGNFQDIDLGGVANWTASIKADLTAYMLYTWSNSINVYGSDLRAYSCSVRCVKE
jgi:hypothetical protein